VKIPIVFRRALCTALAGAAGVAGAADAAGAPTAEAAVPPAAATAPAARPAPAPAAPAPPVRPPLSRLDAAALRAILAADPPVDMLRGAATALAMAEPARARSLIMRARLAPWLPEVRVRVDRRLGRTESIDLGGAALDTPSPVGVNTANDIRYEGRATWDLSKIVFNPDELAAHSQALRMSDIRREVESLVVRLYFERRRLKAEALASDANDTASGFRLELRVLEIEAELDALTGGAFSRARPARETDASAADP
jgi:hypothetical protein